MDSSDVSRRVAVPPYPGRYGRAHECEQTFWVVSATKSEAAYVPQGYELLITGIGKVSAATAVASALARYERDDLPLVVNIGTAGALHAHHGGLYVPGVVINHDISSTAIRALGHDVADRLVLAGGDDSVLATGDAFIADAATRDALAQRADLVDMEGFAHRIRRAGCGCYLPTRQTRQRSRGRLGLGLARDDRCQRPRVGALAARQRLIEPAASGQACAVSINPVSSGLRRVSVSASTV